MDIATTPAVAQAIAFRIPDAAIVAGLSRATLYKLMDSGELPSVKAGGRRLILRADLEAFFARLKSAA